MFLPLFCLRNPRSEHRHNKTMDGIGKIIPTLLKFSYTAGSSFSFLFSFGIGINCHMKIKVLSFLFSSRTNNPI